MACPSFIKSQSKRTLASLIARKSSADRHLAKPKQTVRALGSPCPLPQKTEADSAIWRPQKSTAWLTFLDLL